MRGDEIFSGQVRDPVTELIVTRRDKSAPLTVKGVENGKVDVAAAAIMGEVWRI